MTPKFQLLISIFSLLVTFSFGERWVDDYDEYEGGYSVGRRPFISFQGKCVDSKGHSSDTVLNNQFKFNTRFEAFGVYKFSPVGCIDACFRVSLAFQIHETSACGYNMETRICSLFREPVEKGDGTAGNICWIWV